MFAQTLGVTPALDVTQGEEVLVLGGPWLEAFLNYRRVVAELEKVSAEFRLLSRKADAAKDMFWGKMKTERPAVLAAYDKEGVGGLRVCKRPKTAQEIEADELDHDYDPGTFEFEGEHSMNFVVVAFPEESPNAQKPPEALKGAFAKMLLGL